MPIPTPRPTEKKKEFLERCMSDEIMTAEYTDKEQRYAVCNVQFDKNILDGYKNIVNNKTNDNDLRKK